MAKILLVDDEPTLLTAMSLVLESEGHDITAEQDSREAKKILKAGTPFDLAVFDIRMAHVDGLELLIDAKKYCPKMQVIMLTAYYTNDLAREGIYLGAFAYVAKPFSVDEIIQNVSAALAKGEREG